MHIKHLLLIATTTFMFATSSYATYTVRESDTARFRGEFTHEIINDTLVLSYHITPHRFDLDSARLNVWGRHLKNVKFEGSDGLDSSGRIIIYNRRNSVPYHEDTRRVYYKDGKLYLEGTVRVALHGRPLTEWGVNVRGWNTDSFGDTQRVAGGEDFGEWRGGFGMEAFLPSYGWYRSDLTSPQVKEGFIFGWGFSIGGRSPNADFEVSTSFTGLGKDFTFSEPLRIGYRRYFGSRYKLAPALTGAAKLTKLKVKEQQIEFYDQDWGVEAGIALEGPLERAGYSYSTGHGGYHTFDLFLVIEGSLYSKAGTRYVFKRMGDTWTIKVALHFEGLDVDGHMGTLNRENNRPLIHKALAFPGMIPIVIFNAPFRLYEKITGKKIQW